MPVKRTAFHGRRTSGPAALALSEAPPPPPKDEGIKELPAIPNALTPPPVPPKPFSPALPVDRLVTFSELPHWLQDNAFIVGWHRTPSYSVRRSIRSIWSLHSETVNIHSHLWAAVFFLTYPLWTPRPEATAALTPFLLGAVSCLVLSAAFHTLLNVSPSVARRMNQADYCGIVFLIGGSFIPSIYFGFACSHYWRRWYWALITLLGLGCTVASTDVRFRTPAWRPWRTAMFVGMGVSAVVPVGHGLWVFGWDEMERRISATKLIVHGALYIIGAGLYAARFPERWRPGWFDLFGASHQIFHVLVVAAACTHLSGLLDAAQNFKIPC